MAYQTMTNRSTGYVVLESDWDDITDNFDALNAYFRQELPIQSRIPPMSGIDAAALELVESSDAGTIKPVIYQLRFDDSTDEGAMWVFRMPRGYGSTLTLVGSYKMASANTSKNAVLVAQLAAVSDGDASHSAKAFDSANSLTEAVPDAADESDEFSITLTNADSVAANDWVCLVLYRDADNASDDAAGDFILTSLALHFTLA